MPEKPTPPDREALDKLNDRLYEMELTQQKFRHEMRKQFEKFMLEVRKAIQPFDKYLSEQAGYQRRVAEEAAIKTDIKSGDTVPVKEVLKLFGAVVAMATLAFSVILAVLNAGN